MTQSVDSATTGRVERPIRVEHPAEYYEEIKQKFAEARDLRLSFRPEGTGQYLTDLSGGLEKFETDPYGGDIVDREPINDSVEVLFIGGGFSALLTSARLREVGVESIRIVERGADVGGTWYWNRYPGVACDVVAYDYLPLLDEMKYVPTRHYARGDEIFAHCRAIATKYNLYELAVFQTTVTSTTWHDDDQMWHVTTDRGDSMRAKFVICANGTLTKPKLARIKGMESFQGHSFHTSRWDFDYTGSDLSDLSDKVVGIIGTGATAVQAVPHLGANAKELFVFQRTPSSIDVREDWETDPAWAATLEDGWQAKRRAKAMTNPPLSAMQIEKRANMTSEEKVRRQEEANIDYMMRIHKRIDEIVEDQKTADALKPWYMFMCKRPCFHNDYLPTFNRDNVHLIDTNGQGITEIGPSGPIFDGTEYKLDLLIYATGFEVQKTGTYNRILGVGGHDLQDKYAEGGFGESEALGKVFGKESGHQVDLVDVVLIDLAQFFAPNRVRRDFFERRDGRHVDQLAEPAVTRHAALAIADNVDGREIEQRAVVALEVLQVRWIVMKPQRSGVHDAERVHPILHGMRFKGRARRLAGKRRQFERRIQLARFDRPDRELIGH